MTKLSLEKFNQMLEIACEYENASVVRLLVLEHIDMFILHCNTLKQREKVLEKQLKQSNTQVIPGSFYTDIRNNFWLCTEVQFICDNTILYHFIVNGKKKVAIGSEINNRTWLYFENCAEKTECLKEELTNRYERVKFNPLFPL